ncbi:g8267 [Coccomyxa elongata]
MDTALSSQNVPMTPVNTAPKNKRARKPATAAAASEPATQDNNLHEIGVELEGQHISNGASQPHELNVETAALATALELTGSAEPKKKQARRKSDATAVVGPATPAIEHARSRAAAEAKSVIEERKAVMAAVAAAMRGAGAKPKEDSMQQQQQQQQKQPDTVAEGMPIIPLAERVKSRARRTKTAPSALEISVKAEDDGQLEAGTTADAQPKKPRKRAANNVVCDAAGESHAAEAEVAEAAVPAKKARAPRTKPAAIAEEKEVPAADEAKPKRARRAKSAAAELPTVADGGEARPKRARRAKTGAAELPTVADGGEEEDVAEIEEKPKKRRGKQPDPNAPPPFEIPGRDILEVALAKPPGPRPVPNLGYACLNMDLREQKPPIFTNRDCIQKTFLDKGLAYISSLALENTRALPGIIQWNHEHGIRFFRLTSNFFPWCTEYELDELPGIEAIKEELAFAGKLARAYDQRLTFHPSHFIKLAAPVEDLLAKSIKELEVHSQILDLMGYPPSHENKINIHIGGTYGDKDETLQRFAANFRRLSPACQKRLTVENDDIPSLFSLEDLLPLHQLTGIPLVFDFHHQKFCPGSFSAKQAVHAAVATWPQGIRPVVHWSESQEGRKPHAHSDYVAGPMELYGLEDKVDVMIEAKCKERALLRFREAQAAGPSPDVQMAAKFL